MKLNYIDSMRGIAILLVMLVHTSQHIKGVSPLVYYISAYGQLGVQLFFVASAYTLALSYENRVGEGHAILNYSIRRFFRIAPAYYVAILLYFVLTVVEGWSANEVIQVPEKYTALNLLSNLFLFHGFYAPGNNNIVPGGWSIGTEVAFYLIFPWLYGLLRKVRTPSMLRMWAICILGFLFSYLTILLIAKFTDFMPVYRDFLYFSILNQAPVFLIGMSYFLYERAFPSGGKNLLNICLFLFFTILIGLLWVVPFSCSFAVRPFVAGLSFVFLMRIFKNIEWLNLPILMRIGQASYSMYLIHFIVIASSGFISEFVVNRVGGNMGLPLLYLIIVCVTFVLASISQHLVEKPFVAIGRQLIKKIQKSRLSVVVNG